MRRAVSLLTTFAAATLVALPVSAQGQVTPPSAEEKVNEQFSETAGIPGEAQDDAQVVDKAGTQLPLDAVFDAEDGTKVTFGELLKGGKPVLLQFAYYRCPSLCTVTLNGVVDLLNDMRLKLNDEFTVITVSINPQETPNLARAKKAAYLRELRKTGGETGWRFLSGSRSNIAKLSQAAGFGFRFDTATQEYAHGAALFVVTPDGVLSRTIYGAMYDPRTVRLSLIEAGDGAIGSPLDRIVLYCYHYNPGTGKYTAQVMNIVRVVCGASVVLMAMMLGSFFYKERQARKAAEVLNSQAGSTEPAESATATGGVA